MGSLSMSRGNPFLERISKSSGRSGRSSEKKVAKRLGGRAIAGSGAMEGNKGDVDLPRYRLEAKSTIKKSISLKQEWLDKISKEAATEGKVPALSITFTTGDGEPIKSGSWVMVPEHHFKNHMEVL